MRDSDKYPGSVDAMFRVAIAYLELGSIDQQGYAWSSDVGRIYPTIAECRANPRSGHILKVTLFTKEVDE